jgi:hypothetical protein
MARFLRALVPATTAGLHCGFLEWVDRSWAPRSSRPQRSGSIATHPPRARSPDTPGTRPGHNGRAPLPQERREVLVAEHVVVPATTVGLYCGGSKGDGSSDDTCVRPDHHGRAPLRRASGRQCSPARTSSSPAATAGSIAVGSQVARSAAPHRRRLMDVAKFVIRADMAVFDYRFPAPD